MADDSKLFSDDEIKDILDKDLLDLMGAQTMTDEQKADMYLKMSTTIQDRAMLRVYDALTDEERAEFASIIDSGDAAKTNEYLLAKDISIPKLLVQEAMLYKLEMMSLLKMGKNNADTSVKE